VLRSRRLRLLSVRVLPRVQVPQPVRELPQARVLPRALLRVPELLPVLLRPFLLHLRRMPYHLL